MTEEEQRYARAWKEMDRMSVRILWGIWLTILVFALAFAADELGLARVAITLQVLAFLILLVAIIVVVYGALTFRCPRCGVRGAYNKEGEDPPDPSPECRQCKLPICAPRNPDPKWKA